MVSVIPTGSVEVPPRVAALAAGRSLRPVWCNEVGGLTFELNDGDRRLFVKWQSRTPAADLGAEAERLSWASPFTVVPRVVDEGADDEGAWLVTTAVAGESAISSRWREDPARAVRAIGEGLRLFHEALPIDGCPFSWSAEDRVADVHHRASMGQLDPSQWHPEHQHLGVDAAMGLIEITPSADHRVVCHGDACAPNTLIDPNGRCSGHVDLGSLGVGDRWADLAVATWSTRWNYGDGWETALLDAYGVEPDMVRTDYYRLLWDLGP
jgi:kanamycin kinase